MEEEGEGETQRAENCVLGPLQAVPSTWSRGITASAWLFLDWPRVRGPAPFPAWPPLQDERGAPSLYNLQEAFCLGAAHAWSTAW